MEKDKNPIHEGQQPPQPDKPIESQPGNSAASQTGQPKGPQANNTGEANSPDSSNAKAEGQPESNEEQTSIGKGPKPIGPNQQTWDNPQPGGEVKKEIDEQLERLKKLGENPAERDPQLDALNKKQDIESRNEGPEHDKKSENSTQSDFDPAKHKTEPPTH